MSKPRVSVIIPAYNVEKYIEKSVSSLRNQTLTDIEIILVDDSSTDSTLEICNRMAEEDPRIKVIHKENEGAGLARNAALEIATGEYIGFIDSDDFVEPDMLETLCKKAEEYGSDLVMSGVIFVDGNIFSSKGERTIKNYFEEDTHFETEEELKKLRMGIIGSTPNDADDSRYGMSIWKNLFKNEIIRENNITFESEREKLSEDALFMVDYISHIKKATGIPQAFYNYYRNEASISKSYKEDRFEKSLVFAEEVEKRFKKDISPDEYKIYIYRFWQAMCRVICSQEIIHAKETGTAYAELRKRLKAVCTHSLSREALRCYPIGTLSMGQRVFALAMKHRLYYILKLLVEIRSK